MGTFSSSHRLTIFAASIFFGFDTALNCLTFASYLYSGNLQAYFFPGLVLMVLGAIVLSLIISAKSSLPSLISQPQTEPYPIYVFMITSISSVLWAKHLNDLSQFSTIVAATLISSCLTGITFFLLGYFKAGKLISFLPFPVIGGFFAGVGWLLIYSALSMLTGFTLDLASCKALFQVPILIQWLPALIYASCLLILYNRLTKAYPFMLFTISVISLFYGVGFLFGFSVLSLKNAGFLIDAPEYYHLQSPLSYFSFHEIKWGLIFSQYQSMLMIIFLSITAVLIKIAGTEAVIKKEIDFNNEFKITGIANFFSGLIGGMVGYLTVNNTILNTEFQKNLKNPSRYVGIFSNLFCFLFIFYGLRFIHYMPRFIPAGLLMFFGISYLKKWLFEIRNKIQIYEYFIIFSILIIVIKYDVFHGVILGVLCSIIFFMITYSKLMPIKWITTGTMISSSKQREPRIQEWLLQNGNNLLYIQLQNYIFFGNSIYILNRIKEKIKEKDSHFRYVIYDFQLASGLDSSAIENLKKLKFLAENEHLILILTELKPEDKEHFLSHGFVIDDTRIRFIDKKNNALKWCEDDMLLQAGIHEKDRVVISELFTGAEKLAYYIEEIHLLKDNYLFRQNDVSDEIYYIESGELTVVLEKPNGKKLPIRTIGPGNIIGEISFYQKQPRTASIIAEKPCVLYKFTHAQQEKMIAEDPVLARQFDQFIISVLAERTVYANHFIT